MATQHLDSTRSPERLVVVAGPPAGSGEYQPGVCNIGPAEIAARRRVGHVGLVATVATFVVLVALGAPAWLRLGLVIPAMLSASGYLQAWLKFCAGYGSRGLFNFGALGRPSDVATDEARAMDRRRSRQISLWAFLIGAVTAIVAALLPL